MRSLATIIVLLSLSSPVAARAGALVHPIDAPKELHAKALTERVLIIWDAKRHVEHLIRTVQFDSASPAFGFIVPTPTRPIVDDADASVFKELDTYILTRGAGPSGETISSPSVSILARTTKIAGTETVVLDAKDANALARWLRDNGFSASPALEEWASGYIKEKWVFTAFRIDRPWYAKVFDYLRTRFGGKATSQLPGLITRGVRMSFATERPVIPYREPADTALESQELRLYVLGPGRAQISGAGNGVKPDFSDPVTRDDFIFTLTVPPEQRLQGATLWLTSVVDRSVRHADSDPVINFSR